MGGDGQDYDDDSDLKPLKIHFILEQLYWKLMDTPVTLNSIELL